MNTVFEYAESVYNIPKLLDAELVNKEPDDLSMITYVSYFRIKVTFFFQVEKNIPKLRKKNPRN
jgi:hypothetical protein